MLLKGSVGSLDQPMTVVPTPHEVTHSHSIWIASVISDQTLPFDDAS